MSGDLNNENKSERSSPIKMWLLLAFLFILCLLLVGFVIFSCLGLCLLLGLDLGKFSSNTLLKNISYTCFYIVIFIAIIKALVINLRRGM